MVEISVLHLVDDKHRLTDPPTAAPKQFVQASPCIEIGFGWKRGLVAGSEEEFDYTTCRALISTGHAEVVVDTSLIHKYRCPVAKGGIDVKLDGQDSQTAYEGVLWVLELKRGFKLYVVARDLVGSGLPYSMILGRRFLQFCRLDWQGDGQIVGLDFRMRDGAF